MLCAGALGCSVALRPVAPGGMVQASSKEDRATGAALFHDKGCEHCHGVDGVGGERGPSLAGIGRKWKAEQIQHQIQAGGEGMPAFGDVLGPDEVTHLVEYLEAKRSRVRAPKQPKTAVPKPGASGGSDDQG